jgi:hypothetical protein
MYLIEIIVLPDPFAIAIQSLFNYQSVILYLSVRLMTGYGFQQPLAFFCCFPGFS